MRCGMGGGSRWVEMGKVHEAGEGTRPGARRQCACSAFLLIGFFATASLELCSWRVGYVGKVWTGER